MPSMLTWLFQVNLSQSTKAQVWHYACTTQVTKRNCTFNTTSKIYYFVEYFQFMKDNQAYTFRQKSEYLSVVFNDMHGQQWQQTG